MHVEPAPLASVDPLAPPLLDRIVRRCLSKSPDERFQSAYDVRIALRWIADLPALAPSAASPSLRRRPLDLAARIAAVLLALVSSGLGTL